MCMNCGCGQPENRQGNDANITWSDLQKAAQANHMSVDEAVQNISSETRTLESEGTPGSSGMSGQGGTLGGSNTGSSGGY